MNDDPLALHVLVPAGEWPDLVSPVALRPRGQPRRRPRREPGALGDRHGRAGCAAERERRTPRNGSTATTGSDTRSRATPTSTSAPTSPTTSSRACRQTSALIDSTNPDLSAFFARGGKLIIRENARRPRAESADGHQLLQRGRRQVRPGSRRRVGAPLCVAGVRAHRQYTQRHRPGGGADHGGPARSARSLGHDTGPAPADALVQTVKAPVPPLHGAGVRGRCAATRTIRTTRPGTACRPSSYTCTVSQP